MVITTTNILLLFSLVIAAATTTNTTSAARNRRLLHQPFFPPSTALPPTHSPSLPPVRQRQPKNPFSAAPNTKHKPFFPTFPSTPPPPPLPPPPSVSSLATFPANISSVLFPHPPSSSSSSSSRHHLVTTISISLSIVFAATLAALSAFFLHSRRRSRHRTTTTSDKTPRSDSLRLFPPNAIHSDGSPKPPKLPHRPGVPNTSSEFLYLGTLGNSRNDLEDNQKATNATNAGITIGVSSPAYRKLGSPELRPLPPLPRHDYTPSYRSGEVLLGSSKEGEADPDTDEEEEQFFSPRGSSGRKGFLQESSPLAMGSSSRREFQGLQGENFGSRSFNSRTASYPHSNSVSPANSISTSPSVVSNSSRTSLKSKSSDIVMSNPARFESVAVANPFVQMGLWPPPPPPPPPQFREIPGRIAQDSNWVSPGPPRLVTLSKKPVLVRNGVCEENPKPKLKPFNWDKVRGRSDRDMVWDQLKSNAFQLNEGMIETVFMVKNPNLIMKDNNGRRQSFPLLNRENQVLDPKKSQKIAMLLRALNVPVDEVCEALLEGNSDTVGTEVLESLLKMTPNEEEEQKLKEFKDDSPIKLGPAEKFLKAVLDIPFAFKRVDAMLYIANFESEVDYLERSFKTIEGACEELRNSRMFLKLVEAVHRTGNSMNVGTNCSDANAFKLDTLDKLINVKGTDGKTTLLHFVVQEIARYEGSRLSSTNQNNTVERNKQLDFQHDVEIVNLGLQVVSGLSGELTNVKNAAVMDSNVLSNEVEKLSSGITKVGEVLKLNEEKESSWKFSESMNGFLSKAGEELGRIRAQEQVVLSKVKELAEYFHGNSVKEEAHPLRIFMVVRDFLSILDQVCKEAGKVNERTFYSSIHPALTNPTLLPIFPGLDGRPHYGSSDDEGSSWS